MKREVIRVVTPGTITSAQALDETKHNYLMGIVYLGDTFGICTCDITTGDYLVTEVEGQRNLLDEIHKFAPSEIICNEAFYISSIDLDDLRNRYHVAISALDHHYFSDERCRKVLKEHFKVGGLGGLGLADYDAGVIAAGAVMEYLYETQKNSLSHITAISTYSVGEYMVIDTSTRRNLELTETLREKQRRGSLLWVLDKTKTAMGARLMRSLIEQPLIQKEAIEKRQNAIEELNLSYISREEIREYLGPVYDLERLVGRISYRTAGPRDLLAFGKSLEMLPHIRSILGEFQSPLLKEIWEDLDPLTDLYELVDRSIVEEPPVTAREGGIIKDGYHEEVDRLRHAKTEGKDWLAQLEALKDDLFVANDTLLDNGKNRVSIITGPNMAGKSTYMRQTALIVLMAQIGSFVPAQEADIGVCDRIFTRVGASDDLASGQSTFMVEMTEVANILRNATKNSLIILDEIGRGTSTFDGLSIAWAVVEHISNQRLLGAKTLFATHYHELTELEGTMSGVTNYCIAVKEQGDDIVFLRKIIKGGADKSYGIQVAKLAGVPEPVIARAKELVEELSSADIATRAREIAEAGANVSAHKPVAKPDEVDLNQMTIFDTVKNEDIIKEIEGLDLDQMRGIEALNVLSRMQSKLKNRW